MEATAKGKGCLKSCDKGSEGKCLGNVSEMHVVGDFFIAGNSTERDANGNISGTTFTHISRLAESRFARRVKSMNAVDVIEDGRSA